MVKMRFDIALFSSLAVYAVSAMPVPADNGGNNAPPNPNSPNDCVRDVWAENSFGPNSEVIEGIRSTGRRSQFSGNTFGANARVCVGDLTPEQGAAFFGNAAASVPSSDSSARPRTQTPSSHQFPGSTLGIFGSGASSSIPPNVFRGPSHAGVSSSSGKGWVIAGNRYGANARVNMGVSVILCVTI
ncbi:hypothetical protein EV361DRAFT_946345 [Lentinula raphanica]|nr:hypothetical protein EV361DRAFT_946345 [Lentinula raphanica]